MEWAGNLKELAEGINLFSVLLRTVLAVICGGILGIERGRANHTAGMRTYILVCLGAAMMMLTGQYMFERFATGDPARLGAQVVSGIGFLGAGSIIVEGKTRVKGLTTAAGLWTAACIGLAIGIGFYLGGIVATAAVYVVISKFKGLSSHLVHKEGDILRIYLEFEGLGELSPLYESLEDLGISVEDILLNDLDKQGKCNGVLSIKLPEEKTEEQVVEYLKGMKAIKKVRQIS